MNNTSEVIAANPVSEAINALVALLIEDAEISSPSDINTCIHPSLSCADFVDEVREYLDENEHDFYDMGCDDLRMDCFLDQDEYGHGPFAVALIKERWPEVSPPHGLSWEQMNQLSHDADFGPCTHTWIFYEGKHFDSECSTGVTNFLELPFFKRVIKEWMREFSIY